ncbi:HTH-type transcriptional regulator SyrM 1 [Pigmentiphaga humi]|uniref:HTH-type transcriptional regulator SyrM 1 n=1 Tax=Pigmentiphaga humi TaxID=2478468 RepID=A0A3P4B659_9BURK|nr:LysR family transcriptional regulator [Pigmentiphaga humi]VCU71006.1 HTH-type transcriptional regulator SyrM 1 [Pigmentiphaga humi]
MNIKDIDLNLLVVFNQMLIERKVSGTAEKLGLTQPAVSNALNRLRKLLGDELFLRTTRGMEPTPYARQLAEPIARALGTIQDTLNFRSSFDPAASNRRFTLAVTDIGEIYFLPRLMEAAARIAPGVSINTVRNTTIHLKDEMETGQVDLAIGLLPQLKAGFFQRRLFTQKYVCLYRRGHELDGQRLTLDAFRQAEHVVAVSAGTGHGMVDEFMQKKGIARKVRLTVPHFVAIGHILQTTDMIATVPERYADQCLEPFGLKAAAHPVALPKIGIHLFWHAKYHREPSNQWLRNLIFDEFSDK